MTNAAKSVWDKPLSEPPKAPMGVRAAETITASISFIFSSFDPFSIYQYIMNMPLG
jgi:hypothetical protein